MGTVIKSIGTSVSPARDYTTLQAWEDALPANLVTDGNAQVGECYNDSEFSGSTRMLTIAGETTDATNSITLRCGSGQSFRDHGSAQTNGLRYNQANGVGIRTTATYEVMIQIDVSNVTLDGLQCKAVGDQARCILGNSISGSIYQNLICESKISAGNISGCTLNGTGGTGGTVRNCLSINIHTGGNALAFRGTDAVSFRFCTAVRPSNVTLAGDAGFQTGYGNPVIQNCISFGFTNFINVINGTPTGGNNCTDAASATGTSNQVSKTYANQFAQSDASGGVHDFKIVTGSDCKDNGATDSTHGANDIVNTARPSGSAYDIGCWEFVAAAGGQPSIKRMGGVGFGSSNINNPNVRQW